MVELPVEDLQRKAECWVLSLIVFTWSERPHLSQDRIVKGNTVKWHRYSSLSSGNSLGVSLAVPHFYIF